jgi:ParB family transcriptional regulator, chromosome partitioning protein
MSKRPSKSIIAAFGLINTEQLRPTEQSGSPRKEDAPSPDEQKPRLAVGAVQAAQKTVADLREERDRLKAIVEQGGAGTELDPTLVDPSPFRDRLPDDSEEQFLRFKLGIEQEGQKLAILVRAHPDAPGRYQLGFGHRRTRAARELGRPVRAVIAELTDRDLAIAQGVENDGDRQRLTWIERARFAADMEANGLKARDVRSALSVDDPELTRFRAVISALSMELVEKIGRAPKSGRPKWVSLGKLVAANPAGRQILEETLAAAKVSGLPSDKRLDLVLAALKTSERSTQKDVELVDDQGQRIGGLVCSPRTLKVSVEPNNEGFVEFVRDEMPALVERFLSQRGTD